MIHEDLLILCLTSGIEHDRIRQAAGLSPVPWTDLVERASRDGVAPLLHHRLTALGPGFLPEAARDRLHRSFLFSAARNLRVFRELEAVLVLLRGEGIPVIVLKGAHLAELVYGNIALRPMVDVDLLLRETDVQRAKQLLLANGFVERGHDDHHIGLKRPGRHVMIELHWNLTSFSFPFRIDVAALWNRSEPVRIAGVEAAVLAPEDLLLHLCLHASYHHLFDAALKHFCDVAEVLRHQGHRIDWRRFCATAREAGVARCAYFTLWCTRQTLSGEVAESVLRALQPSDLEPRRMERMLHDILHPDAGDEAALTSANLSRLWAAGGLREKVAILGRSFLPSPRALARIYSLPPGSVRVFCYYPVRWKDHFVRHGTTAWRLITRQTRTIDRARRENELRSWLGRV